MKESNRLKVVIVEQKRIGKWFAETLLGENKATISIWCSNIMQLSIKIFVQIAELLNVDVRELFISAKKV
jgi:hypothetical protein